MFDFLTHINLPPYLLFTVIVLGILVYYFHKDISKLITRKWSEENDIKDLKSHNIFLTLERVKNEAMFLKFYSHGKFDETKSRMCSDFVKFKCSVCNDKFDEFLDNDFSKISSDELKQLISSSLWNMHSLYVNEIKNHWLNKGINKDDVDYAIELFENFRHGVVMAFQYRIEAIFSCEYYDTNFKKILACYDCFSFGIDLLPKDLQDTFENINGRFTNINYN